MTSSSVNPSKVTTQSHSLKKNDFDFFEFEFDYFNFRQPRPCLSLQLCGQCGVWSCRREVAFFFIVGVSVEDGEKEKREEREKDIVKVQCCRREVSFFNRIELGRKRREIEEREKVR